MKTIGKTNINSNYSNLIVLVKCVASIRESENFESKYEYYSSGILLSNHSILLPLDSNLVNIEGFEILLPNYTDISKDKNDISIPSKIIVPKYCLFDKLGDTTDSKNLFNFVYFALLFIDIPLGSLISYKNGIKENTNYSDFYLDLKHINYDECLKSKYTFYEHSIYSGSGLGFRESKNIDDKINYYLSIGGHENFKLVENNYEILFKGEYMFLTNPDVNDTTSGIVLVKKNKRNYILGLTIQLESDSESNDEKIKLVYIFSNSMNFHILKLINDWEEKMKNNVFDINLHKILLDKVFNQGSSIQIFNKNFINIFKNDCKILFEYISEYNENYLVENLNVLLGIRDYKLKLSLLLIFLNLKNLSKAYEFKDEGIFNGDLLMDNMKLGIYACEVLSMILFNFEGMKKLNLKCNNLNPNCMKILIYNSFYMKNMNSVYFNLKVLNVSNNKLTSKCMKYIRHIIKVSNYIEEIDISNNYINYLGLKYLLHALEYKPINKFILSHNVLGIKSGKYIGYILSLISSTLNHIELENCSLEDSSIKYIVKGLNDCFDLRILNLGKNFLTESSIIFLNELTTKNLIDLNLFGNNIGNKGLELFDFSKIEKISRINLSNNQISSIESISLFLDKIVLDDINLSRNNFEEKEEEIEKFVESLKKSNLQNLNLAYCNFTNTTAKLFAQVLEENTTNLNILSFEANQIELEGLLFLYAGFMSSNLYEMHIENNLYDLKDDIKYSIKKNKKLYL